MVKDPVAAKSKDAEPPPGAALKGGQRLPGRGWIDGRAGAQKQAAKAGKRLSPR